jgi:hypothetical protein
MMLLMTAACSSSDEEGQEKHAMLAVYVYAPEPAAGAQKNAVRRRADERNVDVISAAEQEIKSLQLWIYESTSGNSVGYLSTDEVASLNTGEGMTYQIPVSDEFAAKKPKVDVFVQANVKAENCGVGTLDKDTKRGDLIAGAKITTGYFGLANRQKSVPDQGLPMAGMLTTQYVVGDAPALRVGTEDQMSTVQLTRAVSKLRFVFAKTTDQPKVSITSIKINQEMIPDKEYLFEKPEQVTIDYNTSAEELLSPPIPDINETADPTLYMYKSQGAQEYENLINKAESEEKVTVEGPIYLRESDKQLAGTISYSVGGVPQESVNFQMQQAGDFSRNHTWIVYAYYAGSGGLQVRSLYVKDWSGKEMSHSFYNW